LRCLSWERVEFAPFPCPASGEQVLADFSDRGVSNEDESLEVS
jgi:hypothetical protein